MIYILEWDLAAFNPFKTLRNSNIDAKDVEQIAFASEGKTGSDLFEICRNATLNCLSESLKNTASTNSKGLNLKLSHFKNVLPELSNSYDEDSLYQWFFYVLAVYLSISSCFTFYIKWIVNGYWIQYYCIEHIQNVFPRGLWLGLQKARFIAEKRKFSVSNIKNFSRNDIGRNPIIT